MLCLSSTAISNHLMLCTRDFLPLPVEVEELQEYQLRSRKTDISLQYPKNSQREPLFQTHEKKGQ